MLIRLIRTPLIRTPLIRALSIRTPTTAAALALSLPLLAPAGSADTSGAGPYHWTDPAGVVHFSGQPPPASAGVSGRADDVGDAGDVGVKGAGGVSVVPADSRNQFLHLARLTAPRRCRAQPAEQRQACVNAQLGAARELGRLADRTYGGALRFHIQLCQRRHVLVRHRSADFVAMRDCLGDIGQE